MRKLAVPTTVEITTKQQALTLKENMAVMVMSDAKEISPRMVDLAFGQLSNIALTVLDPPEVSCCFKYFKIIS